MPRGFADALGLALREARLRAGLTLSDVQKRSRGKFKPSAVGGYERGERTISVERLAGLGEIYAVAADRLLATALDKISPEARRRLSIDTSRLSRLESEAARKVAELIHKVKVERGDYLTDVITLRSGDIEELALATRITPRALLSDLSSALIGDETAG